MKRWWNRLNQHETGWIRSMQQWWNMLNQDEWAMKQFVSWSWNTVKHVESGWNHGHETPWIRMKQCFMVMKHSVSCQRNTLNQGRWSQRYLFSYIDVWFMVFHGVSLRCFMLFHCCFMLFHCCFTVFHHSVSWCFKVFHCPVSSCFMTMKQVQWGRAFRISQFFLQIIAPKRSCAWKSTRDNIVSK